ncbi:major facilitator superfamily domain-containing protein [Fennellomyces sp. T-0311]|nr:major facilitator superfamily domain-containing protein [Fennellomyces sp. T-0311]
MPFRSIITGAVAPSSSADDQEKQQEEQPQQKTRKQPILLNVRSSDHFIFATAAIGLFTSTFVHSILFPLSPFIIDRINHRNDDPSQHLDTNAPFSSASETETSRDTGILVALYAVGLLVGSPIFGWLGDKIKQRRIPMLMGISASIAANLIFMFAIAYWMLLLARFLQGVSNACVWTMSLCLIADNWPENQLGFQMGKIFGFYPLGIMMGLPIGVLYAKLGYQAPFIASMVLCGIDFFMRVVIIERCHLPKEWFAKPEDVEQGKSSRPVVGSISHHRLPEISTTHTNISSSCSFNDEVPTGDGNQTKHKVTLKQLLMRPRLLVSLNLTVVVATVMSCFETVLTMRLATEWHFDEAACGLILLAFMLPSIASGAISGWFCDKYGTKIVVLISLIVVTPMCFAISIPNKNTPFWPLIIILAIGGAAMAGCQSTVFPEIANVVSNENKSSSEKDGLATSYALFNAAYGTGMCLGPILAGFMYASVGFFWLCATLAIMFIICIPFGYFYTGEGRRLIVRGANNNNNINNNSNIVA